ncbi:hypothetical protein VCRA2113O119_430019 [Vibrio crassostreae]|uniref:Uncharacterized protein n=1 Tax=Vibrio crassostreae TaxID=246167 RepID=A0A822N7K1_9VIBR|nr:hypothetical protein VCRA2113O119_430019 [Vibrio crassostreae]CAK2967161.1 hypothetical protein VCRA217O134_340023 [Vibrio crassostreae]CAK3070143.1 hypothetical protein VCRA215O110_520019 [Vibrio crassostreae]CAK3147686.1 hypothetical protein VCRA2120E126_100019 [Vibrio crassostreae]CAK3545466.1 hypothetical protein VCRA2121O127_440017 [Vibrio crassostreae]
MVIVLSAPLWASYVDIFTRHTEQGKPVYLPMGKLPVKVADRYAGKGG